MDTAISDLSQAIKYSKGKNEDLYYRRGWYYEAKADYGKAIEDYNEAAKLDPSDIANFPAKGRGLRAHGKTADLVAADLARIKILSADDFITRAEIHEDAGNTPRPGRLQSRHCLGWE